MHHGFGDPSLWGCGELTGISRLSALTAEVTAAFDAILRTGCAISWCQDGEQGMLTFIFCKRSVGFVRGLATSS